MRREDAVMIEQEKMVELNTIDDIIRYLIECYSNGINVYYIHNGEKLYSCDGYTYDEYYILAMGLSANDKIHLDWLIYGVGRTTEECIKMSDLVLPVYSGLKEMYPPLREELRNDKGSKKM